MVPAMRPWSIAVGCAKRVKPGAGGMSSRSNRYETVPAEALVSGNSAAAAMRIGRQARMKCLGSLRAGDLLVQSKTNPSADDALGGVAKPFARLRQVLLASRDGG